MSIRPPSDLVLDVVRAADPARAAAATARLARAEAMAEPAALRTAPTQTAAAFDAAMRRASSAPIPAPAPADVDKTAAIGQGLEEMLMRQLLQDALPKKAASVYGAGTAGDVWRGLFAEQLAHALAGSGRLGVGARLVKTGAPA